MKYRIVVTLGPATAGPQQWRQLVTAGATGFRLNTSHLNLEQIDESLRRLADFLERLDRRPGGDPVPVVLDLQASKWRIGALETIGLAADQTVELVLEAGPAAVGRQQLPAIRIQGCDACRVTTAENLHELLIYGCNLFCCLSGICVRFHLFSL